MPIYEYKCNSCGHTFEHLLRRRAEPAPDCPKCGAAGPRKLFSSFSAMVKAASPCPTDRCPSAKSCPSGTCPLAKA